MKPSLRDSTATETPPRSTPSAHVLGPHAPQSALRPRALASPHARLGALLLDYLLALILVKLGGLVLLGAEWDLHPYAAAPMSGLWGWLGVLGLLALRDWPWGRSLGRWVSGISVVRTHALEQAASPKALLLRQTSLLLLPLDAWRVLYERYGRRLGDLWAGTLVVRSPQTSAVLRRLVALLCLFFAAMLLAFLLTRWNLQRSAVYRSAVRYAAAEAHLEERLGAPLRWGFTAQMQLIGEIRPTQARVRLLARGPHDELPIELHLRLDAPRNAWMLVSLRVLDPSASHGTASPQVVPTHVQAKPQRRSSHKGAFPVVTP